MISCSQVFYTSLPILHAMGALLAMGLSFGCDTGKATQNARVPALIESSPTSPIPLYFTTNIKFFTAAFPWNEDAEFVTHSWNPFALIFVFEWLTAGFALRPIKYFVENQRILVGIWLGWLAAGLVVFIAWSFVNSGGICVAMFCTVIVSFLASALLCLISLVPETVLSSMNAPLGADKKDKILDSYTDSMGRFWKVPRSFRRRTLVGAGRESDYQPLDATQIVDTMSENSLGVVFRYAEYCITAPLLFLAVASLLIVDGPAWLFLTGFWLLVVCNALGIALHINFLMMERGARMESTNAVTWLLHMFFAGPW
jgi:hypothetical protein